MKCMNFFVSSLMLLLSVQAWAEIEVIPLKHRSVEEVLPVIRPLLDKGEVANGINGQLVLRTSQPNLVQIKKLLESVDIAPRNLKITVMQNVDIETAARLTEVSGNIELNRNMRIAVPDSGNRGGLHVETEKGQGKLRAQVVSTRSLEDGRNTQHLQVLEGNRALVHDGQSVAVPQRQIVQSQWGTRVIDSTRYQETGRGFYVLPRVSGGRVTLEITAQNDSIIPDTGKYPIMRIQQTSSTLSGRLGEWMEVGGIGQQNENDATTISTRSVSQAHEQRSILIKVEEIK